MKPLSKAMIALALLATPFATLTANAATSSTAASSSATASASSILYVSPSGSDSTGDGSAANPYQSINHALSIAVNNATVILESGTYKEMVVVKHAVTLEADPTSASGSVIINATGKNNAILLKGNGADESTIENLVLENANQEGLLAVGPISNLTISGNTIQNNDRGKIPPHQTYEALHLVGVSDSIVSNNLVYGNKDGGIYLTDETGPNYNNIVSQNTVENNAGACGITITSHVKKSGVHDNTITGNTVIGNGASGIIIATPVPGGIVKNNTVSGNIVAENASGGIKLHTHAPGSIVSGNVISYNQISANSKDQGNTTKPVGISIAASGSAITGTTIVGNAISNETFGIYNQNSAASTFVANTDKAVAKAIVNVKVSLQVKVGVKK